MASDNLDQRLLEWKRSLGQVLLHSPLHPLLLKVGAFRHVQRAYQAWVKKEQNAVPPSQWFQDRCQQFPWRPVCSILMPVHNPKREWLEAAIASVQRQFYSLWELCICDDCSTEPWVRRYLEEVAAGDSRVRLHLSRERLGIAGALNQAAQQAGGAYFAFLDHDDVLAQYALHYVVEALQGTDADIVYSDEDKLDQSGRRVEPIFKPAWSPDLLLGCMYLGHLLVVKRSRFEEAGGFRPAMAGSQDHDLVLRISDRPAIVRHVPRILYHWRKHAGSTASTAASKPYTDAAGQRALEETLRRRGIDAAVERSSRPHVYRIRRSGAGAGRPTLIICSQSPDLLRRCMPSFAASRAGHDGEIIVVQHGFEANVKADRCISTSGEVNYSRMCNLGAAVASGDWLVFLDDQEFASPGDWLAHLAGHVTRAEVGVVGGKLSFPSGAVQHAGIVTGMMDGFGYLLRGTFGSPFWRWNDLTRNVSAVSRAFMALRKPVFQELGGFDEEFRSNFGDVDLCWRARALGYAVIYEPAAVLVRGARPSPRVHSEEGLRWRLKWPHFDKQCDPFYSPHLSTQREDASLREDDPFPPEDTSRAARAVASVDSP